MSRSFIRLRRALFAVSCAVVFGFGATQAFAEPQTASARQIRCAIYETTCCPGTIHQSCVPAGMACPYPYCLE
jgi:hypothetical protein